MELYKVNNEDYEAHIRYLVENYNHLTSCVALLQTLDFQKDSALIEDALLKIQMANPRSSVVKNYRDRQADMKAKKSRVETGRQAPDFSFPDENGRMTSLSSFKGKVVILDFWASWCGSCRKEIPNMKKYYEEFKDNKNVAFISVSIDAKKLDWKKALMEEQCAWTQLLAPNSGREAMDKYLFNGIPFIIAIDQEGRIFRKSLRGEGIYNAILDALKEGERK